MQYRFYVLSSLDKLTSIFCSHDGDRCSGRRVLKVYFYLANSHQHTVFIVFANT